MNKRLLYSPLLITLVFLTGSADVFARAGGGISAGIIGGIHGGSGGSPYNYILYIILLPILFLDALILNFQLSQRDRRCTQLLMNLQVKDKAWNLGAIRIRTTDAFFKLQEAWMKRDQSIAHAYMSEQLYLKHKARTDLMIAKHQINILSNIILDNVIIVGIENYKEYTKNAFWVYFKGSMIDYMVNEQTKITSGSISNAGNFRELWRFVYHNNEWLVDEIKSETSIFKLHKLKIFSEI